MLDRLSHIETWLREAEMLMSALRADVVREYEPVRRRSHELRMQELLTDIARFEDEWVALQQQPPSYAYQQRVQAHRDAGNDEAALQAADHAIAAAAQLDRPLAMLHLERAEILGRLGRWEAALAEYERAAALSANVGTALGRALALFHLDDPGAGPLLDEVYRAAREQGASAVALTALIYQAALAQRALNTGAGQRQEVLAIYDQAIALGEQVAASDDLAILYLNRANLNRDSDDAAQRALAASDYQRAAELNPANPDVYHELARFYRNAGRFAEADRAFARAVELAPERGDVWTNWGTLRLRMRDFAAAQRSYERALDSGWSDAAVHSGLGTCALAMGDLERAAAQFEQATVLDASDATAWGNRAAVAFSAGHMEHARTLYQQAVAHGAGPVESAWNLALSPQRDQRSAEQLLARFASGEQAEWYEPSEYQGAFIIARLLAGERAAAASLAQQSSGEADALSRWFWSNTGRMIEALAPPNHEVTRDLSQRNKRR